MCEHEGFEYYPAESVLINASILLFYLLYIPTRFNSGDEHCRDNNNYNNITAIIGVGISN